jgi:GH15 family glucan-1,4-alpha-glucosidase
VRRRFGASMAARGALLALLPVAFVSLGRPASAVEPHRSMATLSSSNGRGALVWDATQYKITEFLEHPYQAINASTSSRNFAYDSYPGIRIGTTGTWLNTVAPTVVEYVPGTGIIHSQRSFQGLLVDEYDFAPMALAENASVMLVEVTQNGSAGPIDVYSIFNYQVGSGSPTPGPDNETATYDGTEDAYYETGPSGVAMAFASIAPSSYHGSTPNNPFALLTAGSNLMDDPGTGGAITGAVEGFQTSMGSLASGASAWAGWVTALSPSADGQSAIQTARTWLAGRTADKVLSDEEAAWASWITPAPSGTSTFEAALQQQSQALLRMGQVTETGAAAGQILAAVTPGEWNITWVRDMAYSIVALVKSGHYAEAKAALAFQMNASVGGYESYLGGSESDAGVPYQISVCRYYGDGSEWSDSNADGPNIEFDGFGLFLWALDEYVAASGDTASLDAWWPTIKPKVADVLVHLQEPSGMISPDSSIWEVHWDGQERHFTYTTASAANGLCSASRLATKAGDSASATTYMTQGGKARDALIELLRGPSGAFGQSTEAIASGSGWLDASPIEAVNWGLIDPSKHTAQATMSAMLAGLVPPSGRGFMRDQTGAYYDSQEWVFIDLRAERAFALGGNTALSTSLFAWNTDQGAENFDELSELHDATTADYAGAAPMVGFGAGAYVIALADRGTPVTPTCGAFAAEPSEEGGTDAGADVGGFPVFDAAIVSGDATVPGHDAGAATGGDGGRGHDASTSNDSGERGSSMPDGGPAASSSGGCAVTDASDRDAWEWGVPLLAMGLVLRRKRS